MYAVHVCMWFLTLFNIISCAVTIVTVSHGDCTNWFSQDTEIQRSVALYDVLVCIIAGSDYVLTLSTESQRVHNFVQSIALGIKKKEYAPSRNLLVMPKKNYRTKIGLHNFLFPLVCDLIAHASFRN